MANPKPLRAMRAKPFKFRISLQRAKRGQAGNFEFLA